MYAFPSICISFLFIDVILHKRLSQGKGGELLPDAATGSWAGKHKHFNIQQMWRYRPKKKKGELNIFRESDTTWKKRLTVLRVFNAFWESGCIHFFHCRGKPESGTPCLFCGHMQCAKLCFPTWRGGWIGNPVRNVTGIISVLLHPLTFLVQ